MDAASIERAADHLVRHRRPGELVPPIPEEVRPRTIAEGYAVQDAVHERLAGGARGTVVGHKIAATTAAMQDVLGVPHPCAGGVWSATMTTGSASIDPADHVRVGLEGELAVTVGSDIAPDGVPTRGSVAAHVASWHVAIEVVDDRYGDLVAFGSPSLVADDFLHAGAVLGPPVDATAVGDLAALEGRLVDTGTEVAVGTGAALLGHPLDALLWLVEHYRPLGRTIRAGEVVLLGSLVGVHWATTATRHVAFEVPALGAVEVRLETPHRG